jgi:exodeoxyribonuclease V alpha subunit
LKNPLAIDAVIVDEVSMVDVSLMHALLRALPEAARVILVGDKDQLPSVGPGQVLNDVLSSSETPRVLLEQGFRQGANSPIADNAIRVNTGELPQSSGQAFEIDWVEEGEGEEQRAADQLLLAYARLLEEGLKASDIQVLTPKREVGACSAFVLSKRIQALVNPQSERTLSQGGWTFRLGDRVINTQNNYSPDVMLANGDTGFVFDIGTEEEPSLTIQVDGDRRVVVKDALLNEIELAYALTVHKSQGSEFPVVMMPVIRAHRSLLSRRLVYTGMTRARQRLILIAGQGALKAAVGDTETYQRVSGLPMMLAN